MRRFATLWLWPLLFMACTGGGDPTDAAEPDVVRPQDPDCGRADAADDAVAADAPGDAIADMGEAPPATFTELYEDDFANPCYSSSCTGRLCHDPGHQMDVDLTTRERAFVSLSAFVVPGDPERSDLIRILRTGSMPTGRPKMPPADVARVASWIADGARDD